ncbi:MAG TPA: hypothetical protein VFA65_17390, partial [Bryobacteraceae bacterium]|nr:hypothetical protein [Bryobacteraceae bacterium]
MLESNIHYCRALQFFQGKVAHRFVAILVFLLLSSAAMLAQEVRASVSGTVTDPQGAAVAGAQVAIKNLDT